MTAPIRLPGDPPRSGRSALGRAAALGWELVVIAGGCGDDGPGPDVETLTLVEVESQRCAQPNRELAVDRQVTLDVEHATDQAIYRRDVVIFTPAWWMATAGRRSSTTPVDSSAW